MRPVRADAQRDRIRQALLDQPQASLRQIGAEVGSSPETVRLVRHQLAAQVGGGHGDVPNATAAGAAAETAFRQVRSEFDSTFDCSTDAAICSTREGRDFARWFDAGNVSCDEIRAHLAAIPISRIYEVTDEATRRANAWQAIAALLRTRAQ
jgi:hypothetical protein